MCLSVRLSVSPFVCQSVRLSVRHAREVSSSNLNCLFQIWVVEVRSRHSHPYFNPHVIWCHQWHFPLAFFNLTWHDLLHITSLQWRCCWTRGGQYLRSYLLELHQVPRFRRQDWIHWNVLPKGTYHKLLRFGRFLFRCRVIYSWPFLSPWTL